MAAWRRARSRAATGAEVWSRRIASSARSFQVSTASGLRSRTSGAGPGWLSWAATRAASKKSPCMKDPPPPVRRVELPSERLLYLVDRERPELRQDHAEI